MTRTNPGHCSLLSDKAARMEIGIGWREPDSYAALRETGRSGLAWEVLRRDPDYCPVPPNRTVEVGARACPISLEPASAERIARWGLHFRGG